MGGTLLLQKQLTQIWLTTFALEAPELEKLLVVHLEELTQAALFIISDVNPEAILTSSIFSTV